MQSVTVKAFAKLNLSLNVYARKGQFHPIDSLATSVGLYDLVTVSLRDDSHVTVDCKDIPWQQNVAYKAAQAFKQTYNTCGCHVAIQKNIPVGAGLGGSSADAAAVIFCLCKIFGVDINCKEIVDMCAALGSDVNFMLKGGFARMTGKGDDLQFALLPQKLHVVLTTFPVQMSTQKVYDAFDTLWEKPTYCDNGKIMSQLLFGDTQCLLQLQNCLQPAVCSLSNYAENYLAFCKSHGLNCHMTGSGSAYFVPCSNAQQAYMLAKILCDSGFTSTSCETVRDGVEIVYA